MTPSGPAHSAANLAALLERLRRHYEVPEPESLTPTEQLISGFLLWECASNRADVAYRRLKQNTVDFNELRVWIPSEVVEVIGPRYPLAFERSCRLRAALNDIFQRQHSIDLSFLRELHKREAREYLDSLAGMVPYVSAQVLLLALGRHIIPVDTQLLNALIREGIIAEGTDLAAASAWLEHQIPAAEAREASLLLQGWLENDATTEPRPAGPAYNDPYMEMTRLATRIFGFNTQ